MGYLETDRARNHRADPGQVFAGVQSILVLGIAYASPQSIPPPTDGSHYGRVAAYACGDDYHEILPARLNALGEFMSKKIGPGTAWRGFTDTAPILERDLAQNAGLGWIGKNTCLIDPHQGSYLLLAELFLSIPLDADQPFFPDRCGTCTRCIQACPTGCILPDRTLDASRCISYLTIEKKGPIDRALRPLMGNWVFGCDICQEVCPWNLRFALRESDPAFQARPGVPYPDLVAEMALTPQAFNQKFRRSPVQRPHRRGYLRNVAIALGNTHDPAVVPALEKTVLSDVEPLVRGAAAWALHEIEGAEAHRILAKAGRVETDATVLAEIQAD